MRVVREETSFRAEPYGVFGGGYTIYLGNSPQPSYLYLRGGFDRGSYFVAGDDRRGILVFFIKSSEKNEKGDYVGKGVAYEISVEELRKYGLDVVPTVEEKEGKEITSSLFVRSVGEDKLELEKHSLIEPLEGDEDDELVEEPIKVEIIEKKRHKKPKM